MSLRKSADIKRQVFWANRSKKRSSLAVPFICTLPTAAQRKEANAKLVKSGEVLLLNESTVIVKDKALGEKEVKLGTVSSVETVKHILQTMQKQHLIDGHVTEAELTSIKQLHTTLDYTAKLPSTTIQISDLPNEIIFQIETLLSIYDIYAIK